MVKKINDLYYLNRTEAIDYLLHAYQLKWCNTRWSSSTISLSFELKGGARRVIKVPAYKIRKSKTVRVKKNDLDAFF